MANLRTRLLLVASSGLALTGLAGPGVPASAQSISPDSYQALQWRLIGPFRGGRVTTVAGHRTQPFTFYMGATGGGVWKTTDAGTTWKNVSDGFFSTTTIGAIAVAPSNPDIVYVGTGEAPVRGVATSYGDGVYKSIDGGKTWRHLGLRESRHISRIQIDPSNPDLLYVAAQGDAWGPSDVRGVYRSSDGGETWKKMLFVDQSTGPSDLAMDPHDPDTLYAAMWDHRRRPWTVRSGGPGSGIWKTTDGGKSWSRLKNGLPALMGRIGVTVSPADPKRLWAMIEATDGGVFRSDDGGAHWRHVNDDAGIRDRGWYYSHVFADPKDRDRVYVLAAPMVVSNDGGVTFKQIHTPHGDNHGLWINPDHPEMMIEGNDGGANVSLNGGKSWSTQMNQPTGQFYRIETDLDWPYNIYSAQQDDTAIRIASRTLDSGIDDKDWRTVGGGESAYFAMNRKDPDYIYSTSLLGGLSEYNTETGTQRAIDPDAEFAGFRQGLDLKYRFNWNAPVRVSQHDPDVIYVGGNRLLRSEDRGVTWKAISPDLTRARPETMGTTGGPIMIEGAGGETYATLTDFVESPHDANVLWTGSDDGLVHLTRDGGKSWQDVTPKGLPEGQINAIEVSPENPTAAYIAVSRFKLDDNAPYAFKTTDYGKSWTSIAANLPKDNFVRVIREDPEKAGLLYAGTQSGVFVSFDDGESWEPLQRNLPVVPVTDLQVHGDELVASTKGRAIWALDTLAALRQVTPATATEAMHLYTPAPALRLQAGGRGGADQGDNPFNGAVLYYSFAAPPSGEVTMDILDPQGKRVRHFSSATVVEKKAATTVKGAGGEPPAPPLPVKAGMNRYEWNLRIAPFTPTDDTIRFVSYRPPRVAPGTYHVRLTGGGETVERDLIVAPHPGLPSATAEQWRKQQSLSQQLYALVNEDHAETNAIRAAADRLSAQGGHDDLVARMAAWQEQVPQAPLPNGTVDKIGFPSRLLSTQILHALSMLDQPPPVNAALETRVGELTTQWAAMKAQGDRLLAEAEQAGVRTGTTEATPGN